MTSEPGWLGVGPGPGLSALLFSCWVKSRSFMTDGGGLSQSVMFVFCQASWLTYADSSAAMLPAGAMVSLVNYPACSEIGRLYWTSLVSR